MWYIAPSVQRAAQPRLHHVDPRIAPAEPAATDGTPATNAPEAIQTEAPASTGEPVARNVWWLATSVGSTNAVNQALEQFMQQRPNVKVEVTFYNWDMTQAFPAALAAGNPPDLGYGDPTVPNAPDYVAAGQLVELCDVVKQRGWEDRLPPASSPSTTCCCACFNLAFTGTGTEDDLP